MEQHFNTHAVVSYNDVREKIAKYREETRDESFHRYLDSVLLRIDKLEKPAADFNYEVDYNFSVCQANEKRKAENDMLSGGIPTPKAPEVPTEAEISKPEIQEPEKSKSEIQKPEFARDVKHQAYMPIPSETTKRQTMEYKVGVIALSIIGSIFLLIALVSFGKYFLDDYFQTIGLYALAIVIILGGELWLEKVNEKAAHIVTGIGFGVFYFATLFTSLKLHLFNEWVAIPILALISVVALLVNRKRQSVIIELIMCIGSGVAAVSYMNNSTETQILVMSGLVFVCSLMFIAMKNKDAKWLAYIVLSAACVIFFGDKNDATVKLLAILIIVIGNAFANTFENKALGVYNLILTFVAMIFATVNHEEALSIAIVAVIIIGSIVNKNCKLGIQFVITSLTIIYEFALIDGFLLAPIVILSMFALVLIYRYAPYNNVKGNSVYAYSVLALMAVIGFFSAFSSYEGYENFISILGVTFITGAAILFILGKEFGTPVNQRFLLFAIFMTFEFLFLDVDKIWISVIIMALAFILIFVGCMFNRFEMRIYGLTLSLLACAKAAFYDFADADKFARMIVFFIVGLLAIAISVVYLFLEKKEQKEAGNIIEKAGE